MHWRGNAFREVQLFAASRLAKKFPGRVFARRRFTLFLATALTRGIRFSFDPAGARLIRSNSDRFDSDFSVCCRSGVLFRGYPLQTMTRANLAWFGVVLTSVPFAAAFENLMRCRLYLH